MTSLLPHLLTYQYDGQQVEFDIFSEEVMLNATEMAVIFGKEPHEFLRLEQTKRFIKAAEIASRTGAAPVREAENLVLESENEGRTGSEWVKTARGGDQRGVTWMHRMLALKFAAWLSADFEVWVYRTIEQVLLAHGQRIGQEMREKARLLDRREDIREALQGNPLFQEYLSIEMRLRQTSSRVARHNTNQLAIFRQSA